MQIKHKRKFIMILLIIFLFQYPVCLGGSSYSDNSDKIVLICLDGAAWNIMRLLIKKRQLPNFSTLMGNGAYGDLLSNPAYSPPSWTSIATGKTQEKHRVYNFSKWRDRKARYIWDILSDFNIKVGVMDWLLVHLEKLNGIFYAQDNYFRKLMEFYPDTIETEVIKAVNIIEKPTYSLVEGYKYWDILDKNTNNISMYLIKKYNPSFIALGFTGTNPYQHRYWSALEPQYFDINLKEVKEKGNLIFDYYKKIDKFLTFFIENNYTIIFVSDHGFCRNDNKSGIRFVKYYHLNSDMQHVNFLINIMLEKMGLLTFIPKDKSGGKIDFSKSQSYFYNNYISGKKGIRINRRIVERKKIAELKKRIFLLLKEAHFETGESVFINVKENVSNGPIDMADVIFSLNPVFKKENISFQDDEENSTRLILKYLLNKKREKLTKIILENKEYKLSEFIDYSCDGVHEPEGVIIMKGKNIRKNIIIEGAKTFDITPTILYLFGLPVAKDMDGRVLSEAIEPGFIKNNPIKYIETYETIDKRPIPGESVTEENDIKERLRSLGYVQ